MDVDQNKAVFLDRDGVLVEENGYMHVIEDMHIFDYSEDCVKRIHAKGYLAIVITNQSGVARGYLTEETLIEMNNLLIARLKVDAVYYCPHYPSGVIGKYSLKCHCRKPDIGLIERAKSDYNIDLDQSYMVGDRATDIMAGENAGMKTILLETGYGTTRLEKDVDPNFVLNDLRDVIDILV